jgi:hypothetical protein
VPGAKHVQLQEPSAFDSFFEDMLRHENSTTPAFLRGVFWFKDNVTAPEQLLTVSDAEWVLPTLGLKTQEYNWTRDATCFGFAFLCLAVIGRRNQDPQNGYVRLELSPSGRWIWMTSDQLIYIVQPDDVITDSTGEVLNMPAGSLMRITYKDGDPTQDIVYQYMFMPVAKKQPDGTILKMPALEELIAQLEAKTSYRFGCCGVGCCLNEAEFMASVKELSPNQLFVPKQEHMS